MTLDHIPDAAKYGLDALAAAAVVGTFANFLPPIAALFTVIWCSLQIFGWIEARIEKRRTPKV